MNFGSQHVSNCSGWQANKIIRNLISPLPANGTAINLKVRRNEGRYCLEIGRLTSCDSKLSCGL